MSNTTIQLKYSTANSTPATLNIGEPAYSYVSNTLFIGTAGSDGVIAIGGQFYVNQQGQIFDKVNAAFTAANTGGASGSYANSAFGVANSAASYANSAFATANSGGSSASYANSGFAVANSAASYANSGFAVANSGASYANSAFLSANNIAGVNLTQNTNITSAASYANAAFIQANAAFLQANTPDYVANSAASYANGAFTRANNSINANTGGTITADLVITGNLTVQGNTTYVDTKTITAGDSLIHLANNNTVGDTVDIGFYGTYNSSGVKYTGLVRQAGANYFLFKDITSDPTSNVLAPGSLTAANTGTLTANLTAYSVSINGIDVETNQARIFTQANSAFGAANAASSYANSGFAVANSGASYANSGFSAANTADAKATSAGSYANSAFGAANTADAKATSAGSYANSGFAVANSAASYANSGFAVANSAASYANAAFAKANTDFTNVSTTSGYYGNTSAVIQFTLEANGRVSQANTTSIAIAASQITSGTLGVARGGTGAGTFTNNGVLLGQGTSALTTASSSTEGHILTINASGVPTFMHLQGGTF